MTLDYFDLISSPLLIGAFAVLVGSSGITRCELNVFMRCAGQYGICFSRFRHF
jgi:hypothetical protein